MEARKGENSGQAGVGVDGGGSETAQADGGWARRAGVADDDVCGCGRREGGAERPGAWWKFGFGAEAGEEG